MIMKIPKSYVPVAIKTVRALADVPTGNRSAGGKPKGLKAERKKLISQASHWKTIPEFSPATKKARLQQEDQKPAFVFQATKELAKVAGKKRSRSQHEGQHLPLAIKTASQFWDLAAKQNNSSQKSQHPVFVFQATKDSKVAEKKRSRSQHEGQHLPSAIKTASRLWDLAAKQNNSSQKSQHPVFVFQATKDSKVAGKKRSRSQYEGQNPALATRTASQLTTAKRDVDQEEFASVSDGAEEFFDAINQEHPEAFASVSDESEEFFDALSQEDSEELASVFDESEEFFDALSQEDSEELASVSDESEEFFDALSQEDSEELASVSDESEEFFDALSQEDSEESASAPGTEDLDARSQEVGGSIFRAPEFDERSQGDWEDESVSGGQETEARSQAGGESTFGASEAPEFDARSQGDWEDESVSGGHEDDARSQEGGESTVGASGAPEFDTRSQEDWEDESVSGGHEDDARSQEGRESTFGASGSPESDARSQEGREGSISGSSGASESDARSQASQEPASVSEQNDSPSLVSGGRMVDLIFNKAKDSDQAALEDFIAMEESILSNPRRFSSEAHEVFLIYKKYADEACKGGKTSFSESEFNKMIDEMRKCITVNQTAEPSSQREAIMGLGNESFVSGEKMMDAIFNGIKNSTQAVIQDSVAFEKWVNMNGHKISSEARDVMNVYSRYADQACSKGQTDFSRAEFNDMFQEMGDLVYKNVANHRHTQSVTSKRQNVINELSNESYSITGRRMLDAIVEGIEGSNQAAVEDCLAFERWVNSNSQKVSSEAQKILDVYIKYSDQACLKGETSFSTFDFNNMVQEMRNIADPIDRVAVNHASMESEPNVVYRNAVDYAHTASVTSKLQNAINKLSNESSTITGRKMLDVIYEGIKGSNRAAVEDCLAFERWADSNSQKMSSNAQKILNVYKKYADQACLKGETGFSIFDFNNMIQEMRNIAARNSVMYS